MPFPLAPPITFTSGAAYRSEEGLPEDFSDPRLELMRRAEDIAVLYGIPSIGRSPAEVLEIAGRMMNLSRANNRLMRIGDPLPNQPTSELRGYADYYQDINKLASPRAMGIGGGYSYRGIDPFPLGKEKPE